jgi:hypothetical protein
VDCDAKILSQISGVSRPETIQSKHRLANALSQEVSGDRVRDCDARLGEESHSTTPTEKREARGGEREARSERGSKRATRWRLEARLQPHFAFPDSAARESFGWLTRVIARWQRNVRRAADGTLSPLGAAEALHRSGGEPRPEASVMAGALWRREEEWAGQANAPSIAPSHIPLLRAARGQ